MAVTKIRDAQATQSVDLTSEVTGTLPVANGGTGTATLSAEGILIGEGTSPITALAPGTTGNVPKSNGSVWAAVSQVTGQPCDFVFVVCGDATTRATGTGDWTVGQYIGRAFTLTKVVYQFDTADASGNTAVEVRRNGSQVTSSNLTISAANQADGTGTDSARTATPSQSFAVGDRLLIQITAVGTTPGNGLRAYLLGTWD